MRTASVEMGDVLSLAVQRVGGDHDTAKVADLVEQAGEAGDLVGLAVDIVLASTMSVDWSAAARLCRAATVPEREPRRVLPSPAIARLDPGAGAAILVAYQGPDRRGEQIRVDCLQQR